MDDEKQPKPWPLWKKLLHAVLWTAVIYLTWLAVARFAWWITGNG